MEMNLSVLTFLVFVSFLGIRSIYCEENINGSSPIKNDNPRYLAFIKARMKHLSAIKDMKNMKNSVKLHQLILDLSKEMFKVLDESRKKLASGGKQLNLPNNDPNIPHVVSYLENTAFFCDLLVFFPDITSRLLEANLLWRITLIDSIQDGISYNVNFVDENTYSQFEKAYKILSEGVMSPTEPTREKKNTETKKPKRKARLSSNEL